jgi:superfamily II DNA/RNA helicase
MMIFQFEKLFQLFVLMIRINNLKFHTLLSKDINQAVQKLGIFNPTEIQSKAIPKLLENRTSIITAETGSGKTLAYLLPAIQRLDSFQPSMHSPKVLVIVPSRHLQIQLTMLLGKLSQNMENPFSFSVIPPPEGIPASQLATVDIGVASIGCMSSKLRNGQDLFDLLFSTKIVMMDEVDELLKDKVGRTFLNRILIALQHKKIKSGRVAPQFIFCAATLPPKKAKNDKTPRSVILKAFKMVETISTDHTHATPNGLVERFIKVESEADRWSQLCSLLSSVGSGQTLVFCNTPAAAQKTYEALLQQLPSIKVEILHGDLPVEERTKKILQLSNGEPGTDSHVIVATDLIGRGIDFKNVKTVIHYEFPSFAKNYIHRVGRTCRGMNQNGTCISN